MRKLESKIASQQMKEKKEASKKYSKSCRISDKTKTNLHEDFLEKKFI